MELFLERGYHGTTMPAVAKRLNRSRSCVYVTFGSKLALFAQALRNSDSKCRVPGLRELNGAVSPRNALVRVFEVVGTVGAERQPRTLWLLIEASRVLKHEDPELARLLEKTVVDIEVRFRDAIERAKAAAEIDAEVDSVAVARVLLSLYLGLLGGGGAAGEPLRNSVLQQVEMLLPAPPGRA